MRMRTLLAAVVHQAARRGGLHVFQVLYRKLGTGFAGPLARGLACRRLHEEELLSCCADPQLDLGEGMVREAILAGDDCVGAFSGGKLLGYVWFSYADAPHLNGVRVRVPAQAIYRFKAFVLPAYRGRGIASFLYGAADGIVARPGRQYVVNCVAVQNLASIAASRRSGDALLGHLCYWQAGRFFAAYHTPEVEALGLRFHLVATRRDNRSARMASLRASGSGSLQEKRS